MERVRRRYCYKDVLPFSLMMAIECSNVGLNTISKAATLKGLSYFVFVTYSYSIAALVLFPSAFLYRNTALPQLNFWIRGKLFLLGLIGYLSVILCYKGIEYTSPVLASALMNLVPAFTFILAIIFRMEKLAWKSSSSQAKIIVTVVSIGGALIVIFYKGPAVILLPLKSQPVMQASLDASQCNWIVAGLLLASGYLLCPIWYIVQAQIIMEYPAELVVIFFYCLFVAMISGLVGFVSETNPSAWILKFDISLATILYCISWIILKQRYSRMDPASKRTCLHGNVQANSIAIAAGMGIMFLGDTLHLGSIIGAAVIILGFYAVMWGKAREEMPKDFGTTDIESCSEKTPLLKSIKEERGLQNENC